MAASGKKEEEGVLRAEDQSVKVLCRVRPLVPAETERGCEVVVGLDAKDRRALRLTRAAAAGAGAGAGELFPFDGVFPPQTPQERVYRESAAPLVEQLFRGINATVLAYGQTGSGKTFTMGSPDAMLAGEDGDREGEGSKETDGVIPRVVHELFQRRRQVEQEKDVLIQVSYLEIHNECVYDLLDTSQSAQQHKQQQQHQHQQDAEHPQQQVQQQRQGRHNRSQAGGAGSGKDKRVPLHLRENDRKEILIEGLSMHPVDSAEDVQRLLETGHSCRSTASTNMNKHSSRSHAICTFYITTSPKLPEDGDAMVEEDKNEEESEEEDSAANSNITFVAKFHLVDLAGSERVKKTQAVGDRFQEGVSINHGLFVLGNVIQSLVDREEKRQAGSADWQRVHVPYRESKLTRLLQDSLGGNSRTVMIACVSPADFNWEETCCTLKYATRARNIRNAAVVNRAELQDQAKLGEELVSLRLQVKELQLRLLHEQMQRADAMCSAQASSIRGANGGMVGASGTAACALTKDDVNRLKHLLQAKRTEKCTLVRYGRKLRQQATLFRDAFETLFALCEQHSDTIDVPEDLQHLHQRVQEAAQQQAPEHQHGTGRPSISGLSAIDPDEEEEAENQSDRMAVRSSDLSFEAVEGEEQDHEDDDIPVAGAAAESDPTEVSLALSQSLMDMCDDEESGIVTDAIKLLQGEEASSSDSTDAVATADPMAGFATESDMMMMMMMMPDGAGVAGGPMEEDDDDQEVATGDRSVERRLEEIGDEIDSKEAEALQLDDKVDQLRQEYESAVADLQTQVRTLSEQKEDLVTQLDNEQSAREKAARNSKAALESSKRVKNMRERIASLESRIQDLTRRQREHESLRRARQQAEERAQRLRDEVQEAKRRRTELQRRMTEDAAQRRKEKQLANKREAMQQREQRRMQLQMSRMKMHFEKSERTLQAQIAQYRSSLQRYKDKEVKAQQNVLRREQLQAAAGSVVARNRRAEVVARLKRECELESARRFARDKLEEEREKRARLVEQRESMIKALPFDVRTEITSARAVHGATSGTSSSTSALSTPLSESAVIAKVLRQATHRSAVLARDASRLFEILDSLQKVNSSIGRLQEHMYEINSTEEEYTAFHGKVSQARFARSTSSSSNQARQQASQQQQQQLQQQRVSANRFHWVRSMKEGRFIMQWLFTNLTQSNEDRLWKENAAYQEQIAELQEQMQRINMSGLPSSALPPPPPSRDAIAGRQDRPSSAEACSSSGDDASYTHGDEPAAVDPDDDADSEVSSEYNSDSELSDEEDDVEVEEEDEDDEEEREDGGQQRAGREQCQQSVYDSDLSDDEDDSVMSGNGDASDSDSDYDPEQSRLERAQTRARKARASRAAAANKRQVRTNRAVDVSESAEAVAAVDAAAVGKMAKKVKLSGARTAMLGASSASLSSAATAVAISGTVGRAVRGRPTGISKRAAILAHETARLIGDISALEHMRVADLRELLREQGLKVSGKKAELVQRLREYLAEADKTGPETEGAADAASTQHLTTVESLDDEPASGHSIRSEHNSDEAAAAKSRRGLRSAGCKRKASDDLSEGGLNDEDHNDSSVEPEIIGVASNTTVAGESQSRTRGSRLTNRSITSAAVVEDEFRPRTGRKLAQNRRRSDIGLSLSNMSAALSDDDDVVDKGAGVGGRGEQASAATAADSCQGAEEGKGAQKRRRLLAGLENQLTELETAMVSDATFQEHAESRHRCKLASSRSKRRQSLTGGVIDAASRSCLLSSATDAAPAGGSSTAQDGPAADAILHKQKTTAGTLGRFAMPTLSSSAKLFAAASNKEMVNDLMVSSKAGPSASSSSSSSAGSVLEAIQQPLERGTSQDSSSATNDSAGSARSVKTSAVSASTAVTAAMAGLGDENTNQLL